MKHKPRYFPLAIKLWILVSCFVIACVLLISSFFYYELINNNDNTAFANIKKSQELRIEDRASGSKGNDVVIPPEYDAITSVFYIKIQNGNMEHISFPSSKFGNLSIGFIKDMLLSFDDQVVSNKIYKLSSNDYNLYYQIKKDMENNSGTIIFTVNDANELLYKKAEIILVLFTFFAVLFSLVLAFLFARHFSKPLKELEQSAARTASGDFDTPVKINRNDEVGKLSVAIDKARIELKKKNVLRQNAIQYVSHELKTPIMTILSYTELISDRIYPLGTLDSSLTVINEQAKRLQEIVMKLLTLTRLDFMENKKTELCKFDLAGICEDTACRLCASNKKVELRLELEDIVMEGQKDQITVLVENLVENALRYADKLITVSTKKTDGNPALSVFNDGGTISEEEMPQLFEPYTKGKNGITGLGLAIVSRIVKNCGALIKAENKDGGICFTVIFQSTPCE